MIIWQNSDKNKVIHLGKGFPCVLDFSTCHHRSGDPHPLLWLGQKLNGETLLIKCAGAGHGDMMQYARYLPMATERGCRVVVQAPQEMANILKMVPGVAEVFTGDRWRLPMQYYRQQILSLPCVFDTTPDTVPTRVPYIQADPTPGARRVRVDAVRASRDAEDGKHAIVALLILLCHKNP
jgi:hypothetical protein